MGAGCCEGRPTPQMSGSRECHPYVPMSLCLLSGQSRGVERKRPGVGAAGGEGLGRVGQSRVLRLSASPSQELLSSPLSSPLGSGMAVGQRSCLSSWKVDTQRTEKPWSTCSRKPVPSWGVESQEEETRPRSLGEFDQKQL